MSQTTFLLRQACRPTRVVATSSCLVAGYLINDTKKTSCESNKQLSRIGDVKKTSRSSSPSRHLSRSDQPWRWRDDAEIATESVGRLVLDDSDAASILAMEENGSPSSEVVVPKLSSKKKKQPPCDGLNCQPWLDQDNDTIVNHPTALLNASVAPCSTSADPEQSALVAGPAVPERSAVDKDGKPDSAVATVPTEPESDSVDKEKFAAAVDDLLESPWLKFVNITSMEKVYRFPWLWTTEEKFVTEVALLGVYHNSNKSAQQVNALLEVAEPDMIFIELCNERDLLLHLDAEKVKNIPYQPIEVLNGISEQGLSIEHSIFLFFMIMMQKWFANHGSGDGGEFRAAFEYWRKQAALGDRRCVLVLGDRLFSIGVGRVCDLEKLSDDSLDIKALYGSESIDVPKNKEELEARGTAVMKNAWEEEKTLTDFLVRGIVNNQDLIESYLLDDDFHYASGTEERVMLQERDIYMVCKLIQLCIGMRPRRVVVIVGAAHLKGMVQLLTAGVIGNTRSPEEILPHILTSERYPSLDDPLLKQSVHGCTVYDTQQS